MAKKAVPPAARVLTIRKRRDGTVTIEGGLPDPHVFSARWIAAHLGELVDVTITVHTSDGDVDYRLTGYEQLVGSDGQPAVEAAVGGDPVPRYNFTALKARRA